MSRRSNRIPNKSEFEKEPEEKMTRPHSEPGIQLHSSSQEQISPLVEAEEEEEVIQPPSTTCLYIVPLNLASCFIALFDVTLGFAVGTYGYFALTDKEVPKSSDDVMAKLAGIVYILLAFMIVVFSSVMFAGAVLKRTDLVSPFIIVVGLMSACTALMSFTTGVAVNTDENQKDAVAHQIYIWTLVIVVLQFIFIRTVNKFYKSIKGAQLAQSMQSTQTTEPNQPTQPNEPTLSIELTELAKPTQSIELTQLAKPTQSTELTQSAKPTQSIELMQSAKPTESVELTPPIKSTQSIEPTQSAERIQSIELVEPAESTQSIQ